MVHVVLVVPALVLATALARRGSALGQLSLAGAARSGEAGARLQARFNFGLAAESTLADFARIANRYPVYRLCRRPHGSATVPTLRVRRRRARGGGGVVGTVGWLFTAWDRHS